MTELSGACSPAMQCELFPHQEVLKPNGYQSQPLQWSVRACHARAQLFKPSMRNRMPLYALAPVPLDGPSGQDVVGE